MRRKFALVAALFLAGASFPAAEGAEARAGDRPFPGEVRQSGESAPLDKDAVTALLEDHPILLLGEIHGAPEHQALQARLARAMAEIHGLVELVIEMAPRSYQPRLDFATLDPPEEWRALGEALDWEERGWPDWSLYSPVFQAAVESGGWLRAGGPSEAELAQARRGEIEEILATRPFGNLEQRTWPAAFQQALIAEIDAAHCGLIPQEALPRAAAVQRLRDARLAQGVAAARARGHAAVVIAGSGHVRTDRGLAWYLPQSLRAETLAVALTPLDQEHEENPPFDLLWFTPPAEKTDPCEAFHTAEDG